MKNIPDYIGFKAVNEKTNFILGPMPKGDPDRKYGKPFFVEAKNKNHVDKKIKSIPKLTVTWNKGEFGDVAKIEGGTPHKLQILLDLLDNRKDGIQSIGWIDLEESVNEGGGYTKVQDELEELIQNMSKRAYDGFSGEYDIDPENAAEMMGFITDIPDKDAKRVIKDIKKGLYESINEALKTMPYKKARALTKKDPALVSDIKSDLQTLRLKFGNISEEDFVTYIATVATYAQDQGVWSESLDEAAPKMTHHNDVALVADLVTRMGGLERRHPGKIISADIRKSIKALKTLIDTLKRWA